MRTCFLMGQHDASDAIQQWVCEELDKLVVRAQNIVMEAIQGVLRQKPELYGYLLVAYHDSSDTVALPEFFESYYYPIALYEVPQRYAIVKANEIALNECDYLLTYCNRDGGNTGKLLRRAKRMEKKGDLKVVNLADDT